MERVVRCAICGEKSDLYVSLEVFKQMYSRKKVKREPVPLCARCWRKGLRKIPAEEVKI